MSLFLNNLEPTRSRWNSPSEEFPQGSFKNGSGAGQRDGSYCKAEWANEIFGVFGAILHAAGIKPNGKVETALESQVFTALTQLITANIQNEALLVNLDQVLSEAQMRKIRETIGAGTSSLEIASSEETIAGEDTTKAVTPKGLADTLEQKAVTPKKLDEKIKTKTVSPEALQTALDARFTAGTKDLEDGVSDLATGTIYYVYDESE